MWTTLKWITRGLEAVLILALILYVEEDLRGAHEWVAAERQLQAKGESLDLRQLVPPGKPEDDLSKVPIFAELYAELRRDREAFPAHKARIHRLTVDFKAAYDSKSPNLSSYPTGHPLDISAWQKYYLTIPDSHLTQSSGTPAQNVLQVLSQFDPEMEEIDRAVSNPNAYWPIDYDIPYNTILGGTTNMVKIAKVLQLRAVAHLENHEPDLAEKDYLFSFRLTRPLTHGHSMVEYLVDVAVRAIDDSILWEGFRRHAWNDAQLHEMELALASEDMLTLAVKFSRAERAAGLQVSRFYQHPDPKIAAKDGDSTDSPTGDTARLIIPSGWWDRDRLDYSLGVQSAIDAIDPARGILNSQTFKQFPKEIQPPWNSYYIPILTHLLPTRNQMGRQIARAESYRRLARLACRLEEYRIAHGEYPEVLPALPDLPPHLNQEVLSELPLRYERKGDGYQLYSIGWNQQDDGGIAEKSDRNEKLYREELMDWVWPSP
jgi:hypothetical protein